MSRLGCPELTFPPQWRRDLMLPQRFFPLPYPSYCCLLSLKYAEQILNNIDLREHLVLCLFGKGHFELPVVLAYLIPGSQRPWSHWLPPLENKEHSILRHPWEHPALAWNCRCSLAAAFMGPCACNLDGHMGEEGCYAPHSGPAGC